MKECNGTGLVLKICETKNDVWKKCGLSIQNSIDNYIKITKIKLDSASLNNGQNAGGADKMGISGVVLCRLALKWL